MRQTALLVLVLVGLTVVGCLATGCSAGDGAARPEATEPAAASERTGAPEATTDDSTVTDAGSESDAATGDAMSDEEARSALVEASLTTDAANDGDSAGGSVEELAGTAPRAAAAQALFDDVCAVCHGADGTGRIGLDLTISTLGPDGVREVLLYGRPETQMAGFAEILTEAEIDSLVAFVASLRQPG